MSMRSRGKIRLGKELDRHVKAIIRIVQEFGPDYIPIIDPNVVDEPGRRYKAVGGKVAKSNCKRLKRGPMPLG